MTEAAAFAYEVEFWINLVLLVGALAIELFAFVNCLSQRADAFGAIGTLSKGAWLALNGGALLATVLTWYPGGSVQILGFIAITIAAVYLLDVRPALRDAGDGRSSW